MIDNEKHNPLEFIFFWSNKLLITFFDIVHSRFVRIVPICGLDRTGYQSVAPFLKCAHVVIFVFDDQGPFEVEVDWPF